MKTNFLIIFMIFVAIWMVAYRIPADEKWSKLKSVLLKLAAACFYLSVAYGLLIIYFWIRYSII